MNFFLLQPDQGHVYLKDNCLQGHLSPSSKMVQLNVKLSLSFNQSIVWRQISRLIWAPPPHLTKTDSRVQQERTAKCSRPENSLTCLTEAEVLGPLLWLGGFCCFLVAWSLVCLGFGFAVAGPEAEKAGAGLEEFGASWGSLFAAGVLRWLFDDDLKIEMAFTHSAILPKQEPYTAWQMATALVAHYTW